VKIIDLWYKYHLSPEFNRGTFSASLSRRRTVVC